MYFEMTAFCEHGGSSVSHGLGICHMAWDYLQGRKTTVKVFILTWPEKSMNMALQGHDHRAFSSFVLSTNRVVRN
jgi:hypothetical protein